MKTPEEILDRAFLIMLLADRGLLEKPEHEGQRYSRAAREAQRCTCLEVLQSRGLRAALDPAELAIIVTPVGALAVGACESTQWQYEAISALLWSTGLHAAPVFDARVCTEDFHPLLGKHRTQSSSIALPLQARTGLEIREACEIAMLWHWRAIEGTANEAFLLQDAAALVLRAFGANTAAVLRSIPQATTPPRDFLIGPVPFSQLDRPTAFALLMTARWRQHALEWVLGDCNWTDVETNT
jgi:hypothetical protein